MVPPYSRPDMVAIWEPESKFRIWFEIEAHATDALAELGVVPKEAAAAIWEKGAFEVERIVDIEADVKHDVIAFLTNVAEHGGEPARFMQQGMTSSDVLDTCLAVQLARASDILLADIDKLLDVIKRRAFEHKLTPTIGRSHGIHAEPVTFGLKLAQAYAEFDRNRARLKAARADVATCAITGAVGTFANIDPYVEAHVAEKLGLAVEPVSTQVIPRDRHAMFFATLGVIASSIERLATEVRHLQRTEVRSEEHTSELQSLMRISYAVFCLKKKKSTKYTKIQNRGSHGWLLAMQHGACVVQPVVTPELRSRSTCCTEQTHSDRSQSRMPYGG